MFVRTDLSLKYSQKRNFFHFLSKKAKFSKAGGLTRLPPRIYAPGDNTQKAKRENHRTPTSTVNRETFVNFYFIFTSLLIL